MKIRFKQNRIIIWVIGGSSIFLLVCLIRNTSTTTTRNLLNDEDIVKTNNFDDVPPELNLFLKDKDDPAELQESNEGGKVEGIEIAMPDIIHVSSSLVDWKEEEGLGIQQMEVQDDSEGSTVAMSTETDQEIQEVIHEIGSNNVIKVSPSYVESQQEGFNIQQQEFQANGQVHDTILRDDDPKVQTILERIENLINELGDDAYGVSGLPMDSNTFARKKELESLKNSLPSNHRRAIWLRDHPFVNDDCPLADMDLFLPLRHNDGPLSAALFNSIERVFTCFHELIIVIPPESEYMIPGSIPSYAKIFIVPDPISRADMGYIGQQVIKMYIDKFSKAKRVLILEADLIMRAWVDSCFLGVDEEGNYNGKVRIYCATFEQGGTDMWANGIQHAIGGKKTNMDCTILSPFVYHVEIFSQFRSFVQEKHKKSFIKFSEDYYEGHSAEWSKDNLMFSEFNILNHFLLRHRPDLVELVTADNPNAWKSWTPKPFWPVDESWGSRMHCSAHLSGPPLIPRNYDLPDPKLTSEYFDVAYKFLDTSEGMQVDGRERVTLETSFWEEF